MTGWQSVKLFREENRFSLDYSISEITCFSLAGDYFCCGSPDGSLHIFNRSCGREVRHLDAYSKCILKVMYQRGPEILITLGFDKEEGSIIKLWSLNSCVSTDAQKKSGLTVLQPLAQHAFPFGWPLETGSNHSDSLLRMGTSAVSVVANLSAFAAAVNDDEAIMCIGDLTKPITKWVHLKSRYGKGKLTFLSLALLSDGEKAGVFVDEETAGSEGRDHGLLSLSRSKGSSLTGESELPPALYTVFQDVVTIWFPTLYGEYVEFMCAVPFGSEEMCSCAVGEGGSLAVLRMGECNQSSFQLAILGPPASSSSAKSFDPTAPSNVRIVTIDLPTIGTPHRILSFHEYIFFWYVVPDSTDCILQSFDCTHYIRALGRHQQRYSKSLLVDSDSSGLGVVANIFTTSERGSPQSSFLFLAEQPPAIKLEVLLEKEMYNVAKVFAASLSTSIGGGGNRLLSIVSKLYGDHLYNKGYFSRAMNQYIDTIGFQEPSYIIMKYMKSKLLEDLSEYLEKDLVSYISQQAATTTVVSHHLQLLLHCSLKQGESGRKRVETFIQQNRCALDSNSTISALREGGAYNTAQKVEKQYNLHADFVQTTLLELHDPEGAITYLYTLDFEDMIDVILLCGKEIMAMAPNGVTAILDFTLHHPAYSGNHEKTTPNAKLNSFLRQSISCLLDQPNSYFEYLWELDSRNLLKRVQDSETFLEDELTLSLFFYALMETVPTGSSHIPKRETKTFCEHSNTEKHTRVQSIVQRKWSPQSAWLAVLFCHMNKFYEGAEALLTSLNDEFTLKQSSLRQSSRMDYPADKPSNKNVTSNSCTPSKIALNLIEQSRFACRSTIDALTCTTEGEIRQLSFPSQYTSSPQASTWILEQLEIQDISDCLMTTPDLAFVAKGILNMILMQGGDELVRIPSDSEEFLEDRRIVKSSTMDQVVFQKNCTFKVTLEFLESMMCIPETAVRESTDWVLCSCNGANTFYSKIEQRLVLQQCSVTLESNIEELEDPFILVLLRDDDEWIRYKGLKKMQRGPSMDNSEQRASPPRKRGRISHDETERNNLCVECISDVDVSDEHINSLEHSFSKSKDEDIGHHHHHSTISVPDEGVTNTEPRRLKQSILPVYGLGTDPVMKKELADRESQIEELKDKISRLESDAAHRESHIALIEEELNRVKVKLDHFRAVMKSEMLRAAKQGKAEARRLLHQRHYELGHLMTLSGTGQEVWVEGNTMCELIMQLEQVRNRRDEVEALKKAAHASLKQISRAEKDENGNALDFSVMEAQEELQLRSSEHTALTNAITNIQLRQEELENEKKAFMKEIRRVGDEDASIFMAVPYFGENNRYVLMRLSGKGGFSEVWQAFDLIEGRYVACKIHKDYTRHAERELKIMRQVNHPHVSALYDVFEYHPSPPPGRKDAPASPFIHNPMFVSVMEFSKGVDLDTYLKRYRTLKEPDARLIILQVVSALRYLASMSSPIIHYDLKPANILLHSDDPSVLEIKITDFGLSKIIKTAGQSDNPSIELTSQGTGTYWYQPPECFMSTPLISNKVDVWSVGVIFYQMLYGRRPFAEGRSQKDIWHNKLILSSARSLTFPETPKVSDEARELISKCLAFNPAERYDIFQLILPNMRFPIRIASITCVAQRRLLVTVPSQRTPRGMANLTITDSNAVLTDLADQMANMNIVEITKLSHLHPSQQEVKNKQLNNKEKKD
eukprot:gene9711-6807_t